MLYLRLARRATDGRETDGRETDGRETDGRETDGRDEGFGFGAWVVFERRKVRKGYYKITA
ncbi:hypothetical protein VC83_06390 [Pseudogymnoascus destructans]|uniref:Uncharacterized protein n=1 Tax=Pseudogymnoascus destructans TaxID=655981 RepID=A0A177A825_9PEZI|nr:uncharacterized protein VC83_06390 [Pseudogymnoascus destructans]OAF58299.2 hypothetical protein VC83_06390 [Pseudogymnoascus destructans]